MRAITIITIIGAVIVAILIVCIQTISESVDQATLDRMTADPEINEVGTEIICIGVLFSILIQTLWVMVICYLLELKKMIDKWRVKK